MTSLIKQSFSLPSFTNPPRPSWQTLTLGLSLTTLTLLTTIYLLPAPPQKSKLRFSASKKINAPLPTLYTIVSDYFTGGHASILPPQFHSLIASPIPASALSPEETLSHINPPITITFSTSLFLGASIKTTARVTFPSDTEIVEVVPEKGLTTRFVFTDEGEGVTNVMIESVVEQRGNDVLWWGERRFWPWAFLPVYKEDLRRLEEVVGRL